jgi:hypothetical protein
MFLLLLVISFSAFSAFAQETSCYAPTREGDLPNHTFCVTEGNIGEVARLAGTSPEQIREHLYTPGDGLEGKHDKIWECGVINDASAPTEEEALQEVADCFWDHAGPPLPGEPDEAPEGYCNPEFSFWIEQNGDIYTVGVVIYGAIDAEAEYQFVGGRNGTSSMTVDTNPFWYSYSGTEVDSDIAVIVTCLDGSEFSEYFNAA